MLSQLKAYQPGHRSIALSLYYQTNMTRSIANAYQTARKQIER